MFTLELLSGIWIADSDILNSKKFMDDNQITIILNCTQIFDFPDISTIQKIRLPFSNNKNSDTDLSLIRENKTKILQFIHDNIVTCSIEEGKGCWVRHLFKIPLNELLVVNFERTESILQIVIKLTLDRINAH